MEDFGKSDIFKGSGTFKSAAKQHFISKHKKKGIQL